MALTLQGIGRDTMNGDLLEFLVVKVFLKVFFFDTMKNDLLKVFFKY